MTKTQTRFFESIARGLKDGLPLVSNVRTALKERNEVPAAPRIVTSITTVLAVVLVLLRWWSGGASFAEVLQQLQTLIPNL
jgi:hypothetical protein